MSQAPVEEKSLLRLIKAWRQGRATRTLGEALSDGYIALFGIAMIGAMVTNLILTTQRNVSRCEVAGCVSARSLLPWAMFAGALTLTLFFARLFGPVLASVAEGFWLFDAPIRREVLLRSRLIRVIAMGGIVGAVLGALVAALTGSAPMQIAAWAVATGMSAAAMMAVAAAEQGAERTLSLRLLQSLTAAAGVAVLGLVVLIATGAMGMPAFVRYGATLAWIVAAVAAVILIAATIVARGRLHRIRRARLQSGGALVSGMAGAAFALDLGLMRDILVERRMVAKGHVTPTVGRGHGRAALIWRDVQRVFRNPGPLVGLAVSAVVPYAVSALGLSTVSPFISGVVLCFCLVPYLQQMRVLSRTPGLVRTFPFSTPQIREACMVVPGILALLWGVVTLPAFWGLTSPDKVSPLTAVILAVASAFGGLMGAVRWVTARQVNFNTPMMATSAGALPPGLVLNLFRGFDMVALITLPVVFHAPWWLTLAIAGLVFMAMRGSFNMEELQAAQEEQRRELARQKEQREAELAARKNGNPTQKIKVRR